MEYSRAKSEIFSVVLSNIPFRISEQELETALDSLEPRKVTIVRDKQTQKSQGYAYVQFDSQKQVDQCLKQGNIELQGRTAEFKPSVKHS